MELKQQTVKRTMKVMILVAKSPHFVYMQQECISIVEFPHSRIYETVYLRIKEIVELKTLCVWFIWLTWTLKFICT